MIIIVIAITNVLIALVCIPLVPEAGSIGMCISAACAWALVAMNAYEGSD